MKKLEIINKALEIPRISKRVKELGIKKAQLESATIILLDIIAEHELNPEPKYLTSFNLSKIGKLVPTKVLSESGRKKTFVDRIITQEISPINTTLRIDSIDQTMDRAEVGLYLKEYKKEFETNPKGFYLYGEMGTGKSYISQSMANTLAEKGATVAFLNIMDLVSTIKSKFKTGYEDFIKSIKEVDHLFLDDIGAEVVAPWFRDEILLAILSSRMNNNKSTFFTSNFSYDELLKFESRTSGAKYPDKLKATRLLERIRALTKPIYIKGKNRRY